MDNVYRKVKNRYVPVGKLDWHGFPSDGVWLVQYKPSVKSSECIMKMGEVDSFDLKTLVTLSKKKDDVLRAVIKMQDEGKLNPSIHGVVDAVIKELSKI